MIELSMCSILEVLENSTVNSIVHLDMLLICHDPICIDWEHKVYEISSKLYGKYRKEHIGPGLLGQEVHILDGESEAKDRG